MTSRSNESVHHDEEEDDADEETIQYFLEAFFSYIASCVSWKDLYHFKHFTGAQRRQFDGIRRRPCHSTEVQDQMLHQILTMTSPRRFRDLVNLLKSIGHQKVVSILTGKKVPTKSRNRKLIENHGTCICRLLAPLDVMSLLKRDSVISDTDFDFIYTTLKQLGNWDASFELLLLLPKRHPDWFNKFIDALHCSKQTHLADLLMSDSKQRGTPTIFESEFEDDSMSVVSGHSRASVQTRKEIYQRYEVIQGTQYSPREHQYESGDSAILKRLDRMETDIVSIKSSLKVIERTMLNTTQTSHQTHDVPQTRRPPRTADTSSKCRGSIKNTDLLYPEKNDHRGQKSVIRQSLPNFQRNSDAPGAQGEENGFSSPLLPCAEILDGQTPKKDNTENMSHVTKWIRQHSGKDTEFSNSMHSSPIDQIEGTSDTAQTIPKQLRMKSVYLPRDKMLVKTKSVGNAPSDANVNGAVDNLKLTDCDVDTQTSGNGNADDVKPTYSDTDTNPSDDAAPDAKVNGKFHNVELTGIDVDSKTPGKVSRVANDNGKVDGVNLTDTDADTNTSGNAATDVNDNCKSDNVEPTDCDIETKNSGKSAPDAKVTGNGDSIELTDTDVDKNISSYVQPHSNINGKVDNIEQTDIDDDTNTSGNTAPDAKVTGIGNNVELTDSGVDTKILGNAAPETNGNYKGNNVDQTDNDVDTNTSSNATPDAKVTGIGNNVELTDSGVDTKTLDNATLETNINYKSDNVEQTDNDSDTNSASNAAPKTNVNHKGNNVEQTDNDSDTNTSGNAAPNAKVTGIGNNVELTDSGVDTKTLGNSTLETNINYKGNNVDQTDNDVDINTSGNAAPDAMVTGIGNNFELTDSGVDTRTLGNATLETNINYKGNNVEQTDNDSYTNTSGNAAPETNLYCRSDSVEQTDNDVDTNTSGNGATKTNLNCGSDNVEQTDSDADRKTGDNGILTDNDVDTNISGNKLECQRTQITTKTYANAETDSTTSTLIDLSEMSEISNDTKDTCFSPFNWVNTASLSADTCIYSEYTRTQSESNTFSNGIHLIKVTPSRPVNDTTGTKLGFKIEEGKRMKKKNRKRYLRRQNKQYDAFV